MRLRRYLSSDVLAHTIAVSAVLLAIIITGRFVKYLAEAASGKLAAEILLPVMFYRLPGFLELLLPLGLFIGILMAYGRLYVESEMVVMSACGVGPGQFARFTLAPAFLIMILVAGLSLYLTPQGVARSEALLNNPQALRGLQLMSAGRFQRHGSDGAVTYAAGIDEDLGLLRQVFAFEPASRAEAEDDDASVLVARRGEVVSGPREGLRYLELQEGYRFKGEPGNLDFEITRFERFGHRLPDEVSVRHDDAVDARTTAALLASTDVEDVAALYWRVSLIIMVPIVALLALSLSKTNHRRGRYIKLAPALILHLCYLLSLVTIRTRVVEDGADVLLFGAVHAVFALLALVLLFGADGLRRLRRA